ncbi:MAG: IS1 family transposase [Aquificae bacterium]|nr:IS1 family transposase [Aquificota bacterium]
MCPYCGDDNYVKNGKVNQKQTYLCKTCRKRFVKNREKNAYGKLIREKALNLYKEGLSLRKISKLTNIPHTTINYWVRKYKLQ